MPYARPERVPDVHDPFEIPNPDSPFNRGVDALLWDIAHVHNVSGERLERFWSDLRNIMGEQAKNYRLVMTPVQAMLVPKSVAETIQET